MAAYSNRDLSLVPNVSFSLVEEFIKPHTGASGNKSISKGFKYFSEGYVHDLKGMYCLYLIIQVYIHVRFHQLNIFIYSVTALLAMCELI